MSAIFSILIIVTSFADMGLGGKTGIWLEEYAVPYAMFEQKQYKITVASIQGGEALIDPRSAPTKEQATQWGKPIKELKTTVKLSAVDVDKYDAAYIPGGHGTVFDMPNDKTLKATLEKFVKDGKLIASICHGPASLINVNRADGKPFVEGKRLTSFTNKEEFAGKLDKHMPFLLETELKNKGAIFVAKENWSDHIEIDGNLITGQNPQSSKSIAQAIIAKLQH